MIKWIWIISSFILGRNIESKFWIPRMVIGESTFSLSFRASHLIVAAWYLPSMPSSARSSLPYSSSVACHCSILINISLLVQIEVVKKIAGFLERSNEVYHKIWTIFWYHTIVLYAAWLRRIHERDWNGDHNATSMGRTGAKSELNVESRKRSQAARLYLASYLISLSREQTMTSIVEVRLGYNRKDLKIDHVLNRFFCFPQLFPKCRKSVSR